MRTMFRGTLLTILLAQCMSASHAAEWKIDPTIRFRAGYNDNLRMSTNDKISSAEATFSPGTVFSVKTPASGASGTIAFDFTRFEDNSDLDSDNARIEINSFHKSERSLAGLDAAFIRDTTLDTQLESTGLAFDRVNRQRRSVSPNWSYMITERTRLSANYRYSDVEYLNADERGFVDFTLNSAQASVSHVVNERSTASGTLSATRSDNSNDNESTNINLQAGTTYRFSETLSGSLFAGVRYTEVRAPADSPIIVRSGNRIISIIPRVEKLSNDEWGSTFSASVTKTYLRGEAGLTASRDISNDFNGEPIEVLRVSLDSLYRFSETLTAALNLQFYRSKSSSGESGSLDRDYYQVEPRFIWKLKKFWSLSGSYRYREQTFDDIRDSAKQNAAYLTLTYHWPRIAVSR